MGEVGWGFTPPCVAFGGVEPHPTGVGAVAGRVPEVEWSARRVRDVTHRWRGGGWCVRARTLRLA